MFSSDYENLIEKLKQLDEITVMELLEISTEELVDRFLDKLEDKLDYINNQLNE